jgi:hypothetical protein
MVGVYIVSHISIEMVFYTVKKLPSYLSMTLLDELILFACDFLGIDVEFELNIIFKELDDPYVGFCDVEDEDVHLTFTQSISWELFVRTFMHEFVHIKQHLDGSMDRWQETGDYRNLSYSQKPWEKEAYELEEKMTDLYLQKAQVITLL